KCLVEFIEYEKKDYEDYINLSSAYNLKCYGILGLITINNFSFLIIITDFLDAGSINPKEKFYKISQVEFICLNSKQFDLEPLNSNENNDDELKLPFSSLKKMLSKGSFYYSNNFDITKTLQARRDKSLSDTNLNPIQDFLWNKYLINQLVNFRNNLTDLQKQKFDSCKFLNLMIRGFAQTLNTIVKFDNSYVPKNFVSLIKGNTYQDFLVSIISKIGCNKKTNILGPYGLDDGGNISNYIETEFILYNEFFSISNITIRSNLPIFYEISSNSSIKKIDINRSFEANQHSFDNHIKQSIKDFNETYVINLLSSSTKSVETDLLKLLLNHFNCFMKNNPLLQESLSLSNINYKLYQLIKSDKVKSEILFTLENPMLNFGCFILPNNDEVFSKLSNSFLNINEFNRQQTGVFRLITFQSFEKVDELYKIIIKHLIRLTLKLIYCSSVMNSRGKSYYQDYLSQNNNDLWKKILVLLHENSVQLQRILDKFNIDLKSIEKTASADEGENNKESLKNSRVFSSSLEDQKKDALVINKVILFDPISDYVNKVLMKLAKKYSYRKNITIFSGTFNVNADMYNGSLSTWLFPKENRDESGEICEYDLLPDVFLIGLEEVVELTPGQMINIDFTNKKFWEKKIGKELNSQKYVLLWSGQLGGVLLLMFVKNYQVKYIKNIESSIKKTGNFGLANKGGIALSFKYSDTKFCFITSHLAAGLNNTEERHNNYKALAKSLKFNGNKRIRDHDIIIWLGDFNYRILLSNDEVRNKIKKKEFMSLFEYDQLNQQMITGESFPYFQEFEIKFPPTYKFNKNESTYDLSEKMRIPAWTDRILNRSSNRNNLKQLTYGCSQDIKFSDHRPVYALFKSRVCVVNEAIKNEITSKLYENDIIVHNADDSLINDLEPSNNLSLPPPSSESRKWWIDGGQLVKVDLFKDKNVDISNLIINPKRPINPFEINEELDFI
ncbi:phosphoinositide 5-phosphatase INP51, partial [Ascoidea rubescens DSM 1968]